VSQSTEESPVDIFRRQKAIQTALRGMKYIMGYLQDYPFEVIPDLQGNPIGITLKIWVQEKDYDERKLPPWVKMKLENIEREISRISQREGNS